MKFQSSQEAPKLPGERETSIFFFQAANAEESKNSKDVAVSILVYKREQNDEGDSRSAAVKSISSVKLSYSPPFIDQVIVVEHPTIIGMHQINPNWNEFW